MINQQAAHALSEFEDNRIADRLPKSATTSQEATLERGKGDGHRSECEGAADEPYCG